MFCRTNAEFLRRGVSRSAALGQTALMLTSSSPSGGEAVVRYLDADLHILKPGDYVTCAVTGRKIPLAALRYWSVDRQEAYVDAAAASERLLPARPRGGDAPE